MWCRGLRAVCVVLIALVVATVAEAQSVDTTRYSTFPWCKCDTDTIYNPDRLKLNQGIVVIKGERYIPFYLTLTTVPTPPQPTPCSKADFGKVEWNVAPKQKGCANYVLSGANLNSNRSLTYTELLNGRATLAVSNLGYSQADVLAAGNALPLYLHLSKTCVPSQLFDQSVIQYAIFNTKHDCCPVSVLIPPASPPSPAPPSPPPPPSPPRPNLPPSLPFPPFPPLPPTLPSPPPASVIPKPFPATPPNPPFTPSKNQPPPPPGRFPYCGCNTSALSSPWRTQLTKLTSGLGLQRVALLIRADPSIPCAASMQKMEIDLGVMGKFVRSIKNVTVGTRSTSAVYWDTARPIVKFTNLQITCPMGVAGVSLTFDIMGWTLADLCGGLVCQYADFNLDSLRGACPTGTFPATA